jgi:GNAT superfamily N-acetyltransferase
MISIQRFGNQSKNDRSLLKRFVDFHWQHYAKDPQYIPLLDYEYLGFKLMGITGFFEPENPFFEHSDMVFFIAEKEGKMVGRCNAFVNHNHNRHWNDKVGFFGQFECIDDAEVAEHLINAAQIWLKEQGMEKIRGPQNLPVNEATPGLLVDGFDTQPVIYYHYNKPYYETLFTKFKFETIKKVISWNIKVDLPMPEKLERVSNKVMDRFDIKIESWGERSLKERKEEMYGIYNAAWEQNFGFVPFTEKELYANIDDMQLIMNKDLFIFVYVKDECAAFFGGVPNIFEVMVPMSFCQRCEFLRAAKMLLLKNKVKGFRLGYMGVKPKFRRLGLDSVMLYHQKLYTQRHGYEYADLGWVLEDNVLVNRVSEWMGGHQSKTYAIMEKTIDV